MLVRAAPAVHGVPADGAMRCLLLLLCCAVSLSSTSMWC